MKITLLGVPSSIGARNLGTEKAPTALREAGLLRRLGSSGIDWRDAGDLPAFSYVEDDDPAHARHKNLEGVLHMARTLADRVDAILSESRAALILGGDCTVALGTLAGATRVHSEVGLAYFDRDAELNTPATTPSGILDGMVIAHLLGRGEPSLATFERPAPLLRPGKLALLGVGRLDAQEIPVFEALPALRVSSQELRAMPAMRAAEEVLARLAVGSDRFWVHCDLDVLEGDEMPAVDFPAPGGLAFPQLTGILRTLAASPGFAGMEITNFNPDRDTGGKAARRVVEMVGEILTEAAA
ncbi:MAG TPA: arginase family protein [Candidatus Polarisedimenticolia bacterium]|nr:arginase family protein [Candidatus Polarisedimenticolia bacterium]